MALEIYKNPENDQGQEILLQYDLETGEPVYARVRKVSPEKIRDLHKPLERPSKRKGRVTWKIPKKFQEEAGAVVIDWGWMDVKNYNVKIGDHEASVFFSEELNEGLQTGDTVCLDGRLTKNIKALIMNSDINTAAAINSGLGVNFDDEDDEEMKAALRERGEFLRKNSQSGSPSSQSTREPTATSAHISRQVNPSPYAE